MTRLEAFTGKSLIAIFGIIALCLAGLLQTAKADISDDHLCHLAPCAVASGTYHAVTPPLKLGAHYPTLLFLHGYAQTGETVIENQELVDAVTKAGWILLAPNGLHQTWAHVGSPSRARDEIAFINQVIDNATETLPVDRADIVAGGFSQGASMVWDLACYDATRFHAFIAVAGGFWHPYPKRCTTGPINLLHIHGRNDSMITMAGRNFGLFHQGAILETFEILRRNNKAAATADHQLPLVDLTCDVWRAPDNNKELALCLHDGDHILEPQWIGAALAWAKQLPR